MAFIREGPGWSNDDDLYLVEVSSGEETRLTFDHAWILDVDWSPDGRHLIFSSPRVSDRSSFRAGRVGVKSLWRIPRSGGEPARLGAGENASAISMSREGDRLVYSRLTSDTNSWRASGPAAAETVAPTRFVASSGADSLPVDSPDGSRLAILTTRNGPQEIWVCDDDGNDCRFLVEGDFPAWSPDGERIAFCTELRDVGAISIIDTRGGFSRLLVDEGVNLYPYWSRAGRWIYFDSYSTGGPEIWRIRPDGEGLQRLAGDAGRIWGESEDGRYLYYQKKRGSLRESKKLESSSQQTSHQLQHVASWLRPSGSPHHGTGPESPGGETRGPRGRRLLCEKKTAAP